MPGIDLNAFRSVGTDVTIYSQARLIRPENIVFGSHIIIDDFVFIGAHDRLMIGNHVHIASHASITGGGYCIVCDFAGISSGARVLTGSDDFDGALTGPTVPAALRSVSRTRTVILPHAVLGANSVVLPGVVVGEGTIVGAGSVVTRNLEPWSIYAGSPARRLRARLSSRIMEAEEAILREEGLPRRRFRGAEDLEQW